MGDTSSLLFTIFYIFSSGIFIFPPNEVVSAGCTVEYLFSKWLGSETERFVEYHIWRACFTIVVHSLLPLGYVIGMAWLQQMDPILMFMAGSTFWKLFVTSTLIVPLIAAYKVWEWFTNNWKGHPITEKLSPFCHAGTSWRTVACDINIEYRRVDKIDLQISSTVRIIVTDNWILKMSPYKLDCAHQSDTALILSSSDMHQVAPNSPGGVQFLNIEVKSTRLGVEPFKLRLNALDFKDLQDKLNRPITILQHVKFHRTMTDRYLDAFREQVAQNPIFDSVQELELCIGCMQTTANVKLQKLCGDNSTGADSCVSCYCRPMWCLECMGKWHASRQDQTRPETWLASKCTCPVCRSRFCIRDVCSVRSDLP